MAFVELLLIIFRTEYLKIRSEDNYVDMTLECHKVTYLYADIVDFVLLTSNCTLDFLTTVN